jgi:DNA repair protein RadC
MKKFKTLRGVLSASMEELQQIMGIGPLSALHRPEFLYAI